MPMLVCMHDRRDPRATALHFGYYTYHNGNHDSLSRARTEDCMLGDDIYPLSATDQDFQSTNHSCQHGFRRSFGIGPSGSMSSLGLCHTRVSGLCERTAQEQLCLR